MNIYGEFLMLRDIVADWRHLIRVALHFIHKKIILFNFRTDFSFGRNFDGYVKALDGYSVSQYYKWECSTSKINFCSLMATSSSSHRDLLGIKFKMFLIYWAKLLHNRVNIVRNHVMGTHHWILADSYECIIYTPHQHTHQTLSRVHHIQE